MFLRIVLGLITLFLVVPATRAVEPEYFHLLSEPMVRIGLSTNSRSVSISTSDLQLVSASPAEQLKMLETAKITVTARAYRPPDVEIYNFEMQNIDTQAEADDVAKDIREATGETTSVLLGATPNTWRVKIGDPKETIEEANQFKANLTDKGFEDVVMVTEKKSQPSDDAVALSHQLKTSGKSEVRSLVKSTGSSGPTGDSNPVVDPNLREVIVAGTNEASRFTSLKPVAFGSYNERAVPVKLNGKAYRGKIEVFVNSRGTLTVVNVVPLEDYLLGVVPSELGLPSLEAQKAQAVAARTYAVANINGFGSQGFDLLPTVWSQVYKGVSIETAMGTQAVQSTRGIVATYHGKPINALYTSTCGGRTENSENIFDFNEPYLRGVECSLEGHKHFEPFMVKSSREPAHIDKDENIELVRLMAQLAVNNFQFNGQMTDRWFDEEPTQAEMSSWLNNLASKFVKSFPAVNKDTAKPVELAKILSQMIYADNYNDTMLSDSDINYQLAFNDANEIPTPLRANFAALLRDGYFTIYPDVSLKPNKPFSRAKMLRLIDQIYTKKKWSPSLVTAVTAPSENGKLVIKSGKGTKPLTLRPDVFLFRQFGNDFYQVKEAALVGGETVNYQTNSLGEVTYLEIKPSSQPTTAEKMSPFTYWTANLSASAMQSRLSRYVRGMGSVTDVRIARTGYSRRPVDLEIVASNGIFHLKGGKIRSALRLKEQLFVMNKRYDSNGRATSYALTGRGWGHGVGMCQYGAYGMGKMGVKYDAILKHYYTGIELTKAY